MCMVIWISVSLLANRSFSSCVPEVPNITLTYDLDEDKVKLNLYAKHVSQKLFCSKVIEYKVGIRHRYTAQPHYAATKVTV